MGRSPKGTAKKQPLEIWSLPFYALILSLVNGGVKKSMGLIFVSLIDTNQLSRGEASWPFSLGSLSMIFMGPVTGFLAARWKPFQMTSCGVFLTVAAFLACSISTNIYVLSIFMGILRGCGAAFVNTWPSVIINHVFEVNQSLAMGVIGIGRSIGGFIWPPVLQFLLDKHSLKGTFLLLAGISAHGFIPAFGFIAYQRFYKDQSSVHSNEESSEETPILSEHSPSYNTCNTSQRPTQIPDGIEKKRSSLEAGTAESKTPSSEEEPRLHPESCTNAADSKPTKEVKTDKQSKPPIFNARLLKNIVTCRGFYLVLFTRIFSIYLSSLFYDVLFDYMRDKGYGLSDASLMIVLNSSGDMVGRLLLNWALDKIRVNRRFHTAFTTGLASSAVLLLTFASSFPSLLTCSFFYGLADGATKSISLVLVADYLNKDELALAGSVFRTFLGVVLTSKAPVVGYFRDDLGTYDHLFRIVCGLQLLSAVAWIAEGVNDLKSKSSSK